MDILEKEANSAKGSKDHSSPSEKIPNGIHVAQANGVQKEPLVTWVHKNFQVSLESHNYRQYCVILFSAFVHWLLCFEMQGILTNETKCLRCEIVTARDETFLDLSLDIEQNSSITSCLKNFSSTETLNAEDKFFCDKCCRFATSHIQYLFFLSFLFI